MSLRRQIAGLAGWLGLTLAAGAVGAIASAEAREFYALLEQPAWAPPGWIFGPVWTSLYLMMGFAAWWVWRAQAVGSGRAALSLFLLQLAANALWSWLFFAWKQGAWAFVEILVLWTMIGATTVLFGRVRRLAGWLMVPYLGWVTFAAFLCYAVWKMNPAAL